MLGAPSSAAAEYNPFIVVQVNGTQVTGEGWGLDTSVAITVNGGAPVSGAVGLGGHFAVNLAATPSVGDHVVAQGNGDVSHTKDLVVTALRVTTFDVPADTIQGTGGLAPWSDVSICVAPQTGPGACTSAPVSVADHTWLADFGPPIGFDMTPTTNADFRQTEPDGDQVEFAGGPPNPAVEIWDTHGVATSGWAAFAHVTLSLDNPEDGEGPYSWAVQTDENGFYWDASPGPPWDVLAPGWIATATGPVSMRETPTVTKTLVFPEPIPIPEIGPAVVSDTVTGSNSNDSVGPGSLAEVIGTCLDQERPTRQAWTDPGTGYFAVDLSQEAFPYLGWGAPCTEPIVSVLYRLYDADRDMYQQWWQRTTTPVVTADPAEDITDGQEIQVAATGYDLGSIQVAQCELVNGTPGRCDPETMFVTNNSPDDNPPAVFPFQGARADLTVEAKQGLSLPGGGQVDCAEEPGSCAVVVSELYRDVVAWAPLTYAVPIDLAVTLATNGTVSNVSGSATVSGAISASQPTWVRLSGELRQRLGRTRVVVGWFETWQFVDPAQPDTQKWTVIIAPYTGAAFGSGKAELHVYADLGDEGEAFAEVVGIVNLTTLKAPKPPRR